MNFLFLVLWVLVVARQFGWGCLFLQFLRVFLRFFLRFFICSRFISLKDLLLLPILFLLLLLLNPLNSLDLLINHPLEVFSFNSFIIFLLSRYRLFVFFVLRGRLLFDLLPSFAIQFFLLFFLSLIFLLLLPFLFLSFFKFFWELLLCLAVNKSALDPTNCFAQEFLFLYRVEFLERKLVHRKVISKFKFKLALSG